MKPTIDNLLTQLHETFGDEVPSARVGQLMQDMQRHVNQWNTPTPEEDILKTAEHLLVELELKHPQAVVVVRKIMASLSDMGL